MTDDEVRRALKEFVENMQKETGLTQAQMRKILKDEGITVFSKENRPKIKATLQGRAAMQSKLMDHIEKMDTQFPLTERQCPIPGCNGIKINVPRSAAGWQWICSEGGSTHYVLFRSATIMSNTSGADLNETIISLAAAINEIEVTESPTL